MTLNILSIAGSDPSGGAGIQADLKTFSALGAYGMAAVTALTAQNTRGVAGVHEIPADFVAAQVKAVFDDIRVDAVKIGMAGNVQTIAVLSDLLQKLKVRNFVLDPVLVAQSGDRLLSDEALERLKIGLFPLASIVTPNIPEAEALLGRDFDGDMESFARRLVKAGARAVLLKGGHLKGEHSMDVFSDGKKTVVFEEARIDTHNNHGTGCTLSSALAVYLAKGLPMDEACRAAKKYVTEALRHGAELKIGHGAGPVHHFYALWE